MNKSFDDPIDEGLLGSRRGLPEGEAAGLIDIVALVRALFAAKWLIMAGGLVFGVLAATYALSLTDRYSSSVKVMVSTRETRLTDITAAVSGLPLNLTALESELELLRSRDLIARVIQRLGLMDDPEFNPSLREPPAWQAYFSPVSALRGAVRRLLPADESTDAGDANAVLDEESARLMAMQEVIDTLSNNIEVTQLGTVSAVFTVRVTTENGAKSARIANAIAEEYLADQVRTKLDAANRTSNWLESRVVELQANLTEAEQALQVHLSQMASGTEDAIDANRNQLDVLRGRIDNARTTLERLQQQREEVSDLLAADSLQSAAALLDRPSRATQTALQDGNTAALRAALQADLGELDARISVEAAQLSLLERSARQRTEEIAAQTDSLVRRQQLERQVEINRQLYDAFLTRLRETAEQGDIQSADAMIVSSALPPAGPSGPSRSVITAAGGVLGAMLISGLVVVRQLRKTTFDSIGEVERSTGLPILGAIPVGPRSRSAVEFVWRTGKRKQAALRAAVRNLRTALMLRTMHRRLQVVMITSTRPGEGKTTVSLLLAQASVSEDRSVLLLDCDFRKSGLRGAAKPGQEIAVKTLLAEPERVGALHDPEAGFSTLCLRTDTPDPADFLESRAFEEVMVLLRHSFDVIYIDTPPVLAATDARLLSRVSDAVAYVMRWDGPSRSEVLLGLRQLLDMGATMEGIVLTHVPSGTSGSADAQALAYQLYGDYYTS